MEMYQSGFRVERSTMDPVVCLEHDVRKAQVNPETVAAEFFDIKKAYDMLERGTSNQDVFAEYWRKDV